MSSETRSARRRRITPASRPHEEFGTDHSVLHLMRRVLTSVGVQVDRNLRDLDLTNAQWVPLMKLHLHGPMPVAQLARELGIDVGATTRAIDRLARKGLCRRERCTKDRRVVRVTLTDDGRDRIQEVPPVLSEVADAHLAGFDVHEWDALRAMLTRMVRNGEQLTESGVVNPAAGTQP